MVHTSRAQISQIITIPSGQASFIFFYIFCIIVFEVTWNDADLLVHSPREGENAFKVFADRPAPQCSGGVAFEVSLTNSIAQKGGGRTIKNKECSSGIK